jgi:hypothetical protein
LFDIPKRCTVCDADLVDLLDDRRDLPALAGNTRRRFTPATNAFHLAIESDIRRIATIFRRLWEFAATGAAAFAAR